MATLLLNFSVKSPVQSNQSTLTSNNQEPQLTGNHCWLACGTVEEGEYFKKFVYIESSYY